MAKIKINAKSKENLVVELDTYKHKFLSDASKFDKGSDDYPTPKELFLSSVASCKIMTILLYAKRKNWVVEDVEINMEMSSYYSENYKIHQSIKIISDLNKDQENKLIEVAESCPVAHYMKQGLTFANQRIENEIDEI